MQKVKCYFAWLGESYSGLLSSHSFCEREQEAIEKKTNPWNMQE